MLHREPLSSSFFLFLSRTTETKQRFILPLRPRGEALLRLIAEYQSLAGLTSETGNRLRNADAAPQGDPRAADVNPDLELPTQDGDTS